MRLGLDSFHTEAHYPANPKYAEQLSPVTCNGARVLQWDVVTAAA